MIDQKENRKKANAKYYEKIKTKRKELYQASKVSIPIITFTEEELAKYTLLFQKFGTIISYTNIKCAEPIDKIYSYLQLEIYFTGIDKIKFYTGEKEILMQGIDPSVKQRQMLVTLLKNLKNKFNGNVSLTPEKFGWSAQGEPTIQLAKAILPRLTGFQKTLCQFYIHFNEDAPINNEELLYTIWLWSIKEKTTVFEPLEPIQLSLLHPPEYTLIDDISTTPAHKLIKSCVKECNLLGIINQPHRGKALTLLIHQPRILKLVQATNRLEVGHHIQLLEQALYNERASNGDNIVLSRIKQKIIQFKRS